MTPAQAMLDRVTRNEQGVAIPKASGIAHLEGERTVCFSQVHPGRIRRNGRLLTLLHSVGSG
jgi:hypothetical protein